VKLLTFFAACISLAAQDPPSPIVYIDREQVKPGRLAQVVQMEEGAARFCATARCPNPYLALSSITGPTEIWWINGFDSADTMERVWRDYAANEQISRELNRVAADKADFVFPAQNIIARYRDDLSSSSSTTFAYSRFISISQIQIRPGQLSGFEKIRMAIRSIHQRSGRTQWVYQVSSGAQEWTFFVMTPARTMQELHLFEADGERNPGTADLLRDTIVSSETRLYAVTPSLSMPAQSWIDADPEFWKRP
jgi:hypothetical protein